MLSLSIVGQAKTYNFFVSNALLPQLLLRTGGLIMTLVASWLCLRYLSHARFASLGCNFHPHWWQDFTIGILAAFLMVSMVALLQWLMGGSHFTLHLPPVTVAIPGLLLTLAVIFVAAAFEEVLCRGFPLQILARQASPVVAVIITSIIFGLGHITNPENTLFSLANTILAGLWFCVAYFKTRSLWLATGLHVGWNFSLGAIYGMTVSGLSLLSQYSLMSSSDHGPQWLTGGYYGPEGGAIATLVLIVGTLWMLKTNLLKVNATYVAQSPASAAKTKE